LPEDFVKAVRIACQAVPEVERAYVFEVAEPGCDPVHNVGLCLSNEAAPMDTAREVGRRIAEQRLAGHEHMNFVFLFEEYEHAVRQVTGPVFER
jgi:hypothetical protein